MGIPGHTPVRARDADALDLIHRLLFLEPYRFCHHALQSRAERVFSTVYQLRESLPSRPGSGRPA